MPSKPSPRLRVLIFMLVNLAAMVNLGLASGNYLGWGLVGLYGLSTVEGGVAVLLTPGISRLGRMSYLFLTGLIIAGLLLWPGQASGRVIAFGPALIMLAATLIAVGPGWNEKFHHLR